MEALIYMGYTDPIYVCFFLQKIFGEERGKSFHEGNQKGSSNSGLEH